MSAKVKENVLVKIWNGVMTCRINTLKYNFFFTSFIYDAENVLAIPQSRWQKISVRYEWYDSNKTNIINEEFIRNSQRRIKKLKFRLSLLEYLDTVSHRKSPLDTFNYKQNSNCFENKSFRSI